MPEARAFRPAARGPSLASMVFGEPAGSPASKPAMPAPGEVLIVRRTTAQWVTGALGRALCAGPLLIAVPFVSPDQRGVLLLTACLAAITVAALDLIVRQDAHIEVSRDGVLGDGGFVPWWAVDDITIRSWLGRRRLVVRSFGSIITDLVAPRTGPLVRNPHFDDDVRIVMLAWRAASTAPRETEHAVPDAPDHDAVIDLRSEPPIDLRASNEPAEPADPTEPSRGEARRGDR